jgi:chromosome segregation ATPase
LNESQAAFSKTYSSYVKRCDEMKRQIALIGEQVEKAGLPLGSGLVFGTDDRHIELDDLENRLGRLEKEISQLVENSEQLERSYHELHELQLVLETAGSFFEDSRSRAGTMDDPFSRESTFRSWLLVF